MCPNFLSNLTFATNNLYVVTQFVVINIFSFLTFLCFPLSSFSFSLCSLHPRINFLHSSTIQNLESSLGDLGAYSVSAIYGAFCISALFVATPVNSLLPPKWALIVGGSCYLVYTAANLYPRWGTNLWYLYLIIYCYLFTLFFCYLLYFIYIPLSVFFYFIFYLTSFSICSICLDILFIFYLLFCLL